jgi:hypothetical protein
MTYDCGDAEQNADGLVVTEFLLEVENKSSEYAECNIEGGVYWGTQYQQVAVATCPPTISTTNSSCYSEPINTRGAY